MFLNDWITELQTSLFRDLLAFAPELVLCGGIVMLLFLRLFSRLNRLHLGLFALGIALMALALSGWQWYSLETNLDTRMRVRPLSAAEDLFAGMLVQDKLTVYMRIFLFGFTSLVIWLTLLTGIPDREDSGDFYSLLLGATVGMSLMASANHLLMIFIGVEMASLPSYALAGFLKGRRQSSEAALKYVVYGGGASGIMLYGISLLSGKFGTGYLPDVAKGFAEVLWQAPSGAGLDALLVLGTLFVLVGVGFKLAAFPFHFWCPDVFEGAAAEVAAFLSVASKGAALALAGRFVLVLGGLAGRAPDYDTWFKMAPYLGMPLATFAALTATFGNLAAYLQTNLKRLLAYSTIAHAGYMLMGVAAMTPDGVGAVLFYLIPYLFMNLGAFAIVAFLRNQTGSEDLSSFAGLVQRSPLLVITLGFFLLSLLGIPPLAGFAAKFQIFRVLYDAGKLYTAKEEYLHSPLLAYTMYALLFIGGLNTVFSLVYYVKVLKVMILDRAPGELEGQEQAPIPLPQGPAVYASLLAAVVFLLGIFWDPLARTAAAGVDRFHAVSIARPVHRTSPRLTAQPEQEGDNQDQAEAPQRGQR
jgi:NADH-quinone oxidoreductase subunit N